MLRCIEVALRSDVKGQSLVRRETGKE
jgi:hypothetical protein